MSSVLLFYFLRSISASFPSSGGKVASGSPRHSASWPRNLCEKILFLQYFQQNLRVQYCWASLDHSPLIPPVILARGRKTLVRCGSYIYPQSRSRTADLCKGWRKGQPRVKHEMGDVPVTTPKYACQKENGPRRGEKTAVRVTVAQPAGLTK